MPSSNPTDQGAPDPLATFQVLARAPEFYGRTWDALHVPGRAATFSPIPDWVHPHVRATLEGAAPFGLYEYQGEAITEVRDGHSIVVTSATGTGKSWCYQIPIMDRIARGEPASALILTPTKALAADQLRALLHWKVPGARPFSFDGDTPEVDRAAARRSANVLITNPDMLSRTLLPDHRRWSRFLSTLSLVVVDELHTIRGTFGTHVALTLARLERLVAGLGGSFSYCSTSATLGEPGAFAEVVTGRQSKVIADVNGQAGDRDVILWSRPVVDPAAGIRSSLPVEVGTLLAGFVDAGLATIAFTDSRIGAERIAAIARDRSRRPGDIVTYRAGLLTEERRTIERGLSDGTVRGVVATSALELGVNLPGFDVAILSGFPGTLASFWQRVGRAGRSARPSIALLIEGNDQLDAFYRRNPQLLVDREIETPVVNRGNPVLLAQHLGAAASEAPVSSADERFFGVPIDEAAALLMERGVARMRDGLLYWTADPRDAPPRTLRGGGHGDLELFDESDRLIGTAPSNGAIYPGAVYLHQGIQYEVTAMSLDEHWARVRPDGRDVWTQSDRTSSMEVVDLDRSRELAGATAHVGRLRIREHRLGHRVIDRTSGKVLERVRSEIPHTEMVVSGIWFTLDMDACAATIGVSSVGGAPTLLVGSALHAAEHALIGMVPRYAMADRWDLGGLSSASPSPSISVHEAMPGGTGISQVLFERAERWLADTQSLIGTCDCLNGCPSCVQSPKCGNFNEYLDKDGAVAIIDMMLTGPR
ncbi:MAG: DEAD/DEAH box helicase [Acidimicrobiia bacterium]